MSVATLQTSCGIVEWLLIGKTLRTIYHGSPSNLTASERRRCRDVRKSVKSIWL